MELSLPPPETVSYWKSEINHQNSMVAPFTSQYGYYRKIRNVQEPNTTVTFTDLIPLPTKPSLDLIEALVKKNKKAEAEDVVAPESIVEMVQEDPSPPFLEEPSDLPDSLQFNYFYPVTGSTKPPKTSSSIGAEKTPVKTTPTTPTNAGKKRGRPRLSSPSVLSSLSSLLSNPTNTTAAKMEAASSSSANAAATELLEPHNVVVHNHDTATTAATSTFTTPPTTNRSYILAKVSKILKEEYMVSEEDTLSREYCDAAQIVGRIEAIVKEKTGIEILNAQSCIPKVLSAMGFVKRSKRNVDMSNGSRKIVNEWNFPLHKVG
jgi:hypothetical protein